VILYDSALPHGDYQCSSCFWWWSVLF